MKSFFKKTYEMYRDGFRSMTIGKTLWIVIAVKLAILFLIIKLFFFPDKLQENYSTDTERAEAVRTAMTEMQN